VESYALLLRPGLLAHTNDEAKNILYLIAIGGHD